VRSNSSDRHRSVRPPTGFLDQAGEVARGFPGFRADELLKPVPGIQDEWTVLYRFDTAEHADAWLESPERKRLLAEQGERFADFELLLVGL